MKYLLLLVLAFNIQAAQIVGKLSPTKECESSKTGQLFVSENGQLIYQIEIPTKGSFNIELPKGKFKFSYLTKNGCSFDKTIPHSTKEQTINFKVSK